MPILTWWTAEQQQAVTYTKELNIPNGKIWTPALLWQFDCASENLTICALRRSERPTKKTQLYYAPFHNVYGRDQIAEENQVCLGSGGMKAVKKAAEARDFATLMRTVETVFWRTTFSEIHNVKAADQNLNTLHHHLVTTGARFPLDKLVPIKTKLWK